MNLFLLSDSKNKYLYYHCVTPARELVKMIQYIFSRYSCVAVQSGPPLTLLGSQLRTSWRRSYVSHLCLCVLGASSYSGTIRLNAHILDQRWSTARHRAQISFARSAVEIPWQIALAFMMSAICLGHLCFCFLYLQCYPENVPLSCISPILKLFWYIHYLVLKCPAQ